MFCLEQPFSPPFVAAGAKVPVFASALLRSAGLTTDTFIWGGLLGTNNCKKAESTGEWSESTVVPGKEQAVAHRICT